MRQRQHAGSCRRRAVPGERRRAAARATGLKSPTTSAADPPHDLEARAAPRDRSSRSFSAQQVLRGMAYLSRRPSNSTDGGVLRPEEVHAPRSISQPRRQTQAWSSRRAADHRAPRSPPATGSSPGDSARPSARCAGTRRTVRPPVSCASSLIRVSVARSRSQHGVDRWRRRPAARARRPRSTRGPSPMEVTGSPRRRSILRPAGPARSRARATPPRSASSASRRTTHVDEPVVGGPAAGQPVQLSSAERWDEHCSRSSTRSTAANASPRRVRRRRTSAA